MEALEMVSKMDCCYSGFDGIFPSSSIDAEVKLIGNDSLGFYITDNKSLEVD